MFQPNSSDDFSSKTKKMKFEFLLLFILTLFIFTSCDNLPEAQPELDSTNQLLYFTLEKNKNVVCLKEDIVGTIENNVIKLTMPERLKISKLIATFTHNGEAVFIGSASQTSDITANNFSKPLLYTVKAEDNSKKNYSLNITWITEKPDHVPHFYIDTEDTLAITSKSDYIKGTIRIVGDGECEDFEGPMSIRGRGNSTWDMPKKSYKFKLDSKASLLSLPPEKDWILLANYIDHSLMCNAVAMKIGQLLEMPFTNHIIPVDVTLNGEYMGSYMFTEQKEVKDSRINVGKDGWLLELDINFDQDPWQFISERFQLPVMIQYPKLNEMAETEAHPIFDEMQSDFNAFEELIFDASFPNNNYLDYFDAAAFVNYLIVYTLTANGEINHPKSTYMYKKKNEKFNMGPIWDFDWAFGYNGSGEHFIDPIGILFWTGDTFFSKITHDPVIQSLYKTEWRKFKKQKYPFLKKYLKEYAETIRESHAKDQERWKQGTESIDEYLARLLD